MTDMEQLELQVRQLAPQDFKKFHEWCHAYEWQAWDSQIEANSVKPGKLKTQADKARADHADNFTSRM